MRASMILVCLFTSWSFAAPTTKKSDVQTQRDAHAKELVALIKKDLPSGWSVAYQPYFPGIEIKRLKPTAMYSGPIISAPVPDPNAKPEKAAPLPTYECFLRIENFLSTTNYKKQKAVNAQKRQEMTRVSSGLIFGKGRYVGRNPEENERIQRYEKLEKSLYELPDYYWRHLSFSNISIDLWGKPDYELVIDDKVRAECKQVTLKVLGLLTPYEKEK